MSPDDPAPAAPPEIRFLDHTADVGIRVHALDRARLFHGAALGMLALLRGEDEGSFTPPSGPARGPATDLHTLELEARSPAALMADWLREILFLHETGGRDYVVAEFDALDDHGLRARVRTTPGGVAVREIKGVTYHELAVEATASGWEATVIFDV